MDSLDSTGASIGRQVVDLAVAVVMVVSTSSVTLTGPDRESDVVHVPRSIIISMFAHPRSITQLTA